MWFFCLLPLILPWSNMKLKWEGICCILVWMGAQTHWLMWGYMLEFRGKNVFLQLWMASLVFLAANTFVLIMIIRHHRHSPVFKGVEHASSENAIKLEWGTQPHEWWNLRIFIHHGFAIALLVLKLSGVEQFLWYCFGNL